MMTMVPSNRKPNVGVSSRSVPSVNGTDFLAPRLAAIAIGATIGMKRLNRITSPAAMSHGIACDAGLGLLSKPKLVPSPSKAEPLFAEADENW